VHFNGKSKRGWKIEETGDFLLGEEIHDSFEVFRGFSR
jgi:hypothetical protein